jgi:predicted nucleotidyltransferase
VATDPRRVLERLDRDIGAALGDGLRGLYVHGSWAAGDFHPARSDLDLLAVLTADPTDHTAETLRVLHDRVAADHPEWTDRVEVEYLSSAALTRYRIEPRPMVRISPGEPLHVVPATRHYVLNWHAARERGIVLRGPPPGELLPDFGPEFLETVREHARQWPAWVREMSGTGSHAYAVLSLCRALYSATGGGQASKRRAASYAAAALPHRATLIGWASRWWYEGRADDESAPVAEVVAFVDEVSARVVAASTPAARW